jgi:HEAT repeat protein
MELLSDGQSDVRWSTALALGALGDPLAVERLGQVLQDKTWDRRRVAAASLAEINSERSVEILIAALQDQDADVAWSAAYALWRLSDARALPELEHVMREDTRQASHGEPLAKLARKAIERIDLIRHRQQDRASLRRLSGDSQHIRLRPSQG